MQNRFPSSTKNSGREEEEKDSSRVFLTNACDEPASQLNPDRDKIFNFLENNFFLQIAQYSTSTRFFAWFGESVEAGEKPPEMLFASIYIASSVVLTETFKENQVVNYKGKNRLCI